MGNNVDDIAAKWNAAFGQPEPQEPTEPDAAEAEPVEIGKGHYIESAGHQPDKIPSPPAKTNNQMLAELLEQQRQGFAWYGPQTPK